MSTEDWCDHCELRLSECAHGRPPEDDRPKLGTIVIAQYAGRCGYCPKSIEEGDHIGRSTDWRDESWYHYGCGQ